MSQVTKRALEESLKQLMLEKPFTKITVNDIVENCGINRGTFYYHFNDIYDLVEWACQEDAKKAIQGKKTYSTWQEGLQNIFVAVRENKPFIMNVYHTISQDQIRRYLYSVTLDLIQDVVEEMSAGVNVSEEDKLFVANFYKYSFVGIMLDWIDRDMQDDEFQLVELISVTIQDNIYHALKRFASVA